MKSITRTITTKVVKATAVHFENGEMKSRELNHLETIEEMTDRKIKLYFDEQCKEGETSVIYQRSNKEEIYTIKLEDFLKYATKLEMKTQEEAKPNEEINSEVASVANSKEIDLKDMTKEKANSLYAVVQNETVGTDKKDKKEKKNNK